MLLKLKNTFIFKIKKMERSISMESLLGCCIRKIVIILAVEKHTMHDTYKDAIHQLPQDISESILNALLGTGYMKPSLFSIFLNSEIKCIDFGKIDIGCIIDSSLVGYYCPDLIEVNFNESPWEEKDILSCIVRLKKLEVVNFCRASNITDIVVSKICENTLFNLKHLDLRWCEMVSNVSLYIIGKTCHNLEFLGLTGCVLISDEGLFSLQQLYHLKELHLQGCSKVKKLPIGCYKRIKVLDIRGLSDINSVTLTQFLRPIISQLTKLNVSETMITPECIDEICREYNSSTCELQHVDFSWCFNLSNKEMSNLISSACNLLVLKTRCTEMNDEGLHVVAHTCKKLQKLNVARCNHIGDTSMIEIAKYCLELKDIDISWSDVSDCGIQALFKYSKYLKSIRAQGCKSIGKECLMLLLSTGGPSIRWMDFSWADYINAKAVHPIIQTRTEMAIIDYYGDMIMGKNYKGKIIKE